MQNKIATMKKYNNKYYCFSVYFFIVSLIVHHHYYSLSLYGNNILRCEKRNFFFSGSCVDVSKFTFLFFGIFLLLLLLLSLSLSLLLLSKFIIIIYNQILY